MTAEPFRLHMPRHRSTPVVFASPHSGSAYSAEFVASSQLDSHRLRSSEDAFVDTLFGDAPLHGAPLLAAVAPRAWIDLNRGPDELDPALIRDVARGSHNPRISSGLGVVPRVVSNGRAIYHGKIDLIEAERRLNSVWHPYHATLTMLLSESRNLFGQAILIDCHSMPHEAVTSARGNSGSTPDIVLGDRYGASADKSVVAEIQAAFMAEGFLVARNSPFAGAYTAQHYGRPSLGQHAIQVEIDRSLYMDEATIRPNAEFEAVAAAIGRVIARIVSLGAGQMPLAAE